MAGGREWDRKVGVGVLRRDGKRGGVFTELQPHRPHTYADVRDSVSNRRQGTYLYIALTFHRMCCPFLPGWTAGVDGGPGRGAGHTQNGSWITLW